MTGGEATSETTRRPLVGTTLVVLLAALLAACVAREPTDRMTQPASPGEERRWLAVLETAADPSELDAAADQVLEAVDGATVVSPARCFRPTQGAFPVPDGRYVLGVVARSEEELARLVAATGREPVFTGEVVDTCGR